MSELTLLEHLTLPPNHPARELSRAAWQEASVDFELPADIAEHRHRQLGAKATEVYDDEHAA